MHPHNSLAKNEKNNKIQKALNVNLFHTYDVIKTRIQFFNVYFAVLRNVKQVKHLKQVKSWFLKIASKKVKKVYYMKT